MRKLIAIGGGTGNTPGGFPKTGTFIFDRELVKLAKKKHPRLLFIPTASKDAVSYTAAVEAYFGKRLGCKVQPLYTVGRNPSRQELREKIFDTDIIYVGGGNTLYMVTRWKKLGIDKLLRQAYERGVVMSGLSAGAICWFKNGTSDSRMMTDSTFKDYIRVSGLNWFGLTLSPHHLAERKRKPALIKQIRRYGGVGLALDDFVAVEILADKFRIMSAKSIAKAHKVYRKNQRIIYIEIPKNKLYPIDDLLSPLKLVGD